MTDKIIETEKPAEVSGTVGFGLGQLENPTPKWATWAFRIYLYAASFSIFVLTTLPAKRISAELALEIIGYISMSVVGVHGLSKMVGINIEQDAANASSAFNLKSK